MTDKDFDEAFGSNGAGPTTFTSRLGRSDASEQNGHAKEETAGSEPYKAYGIFPTNTVGQTCDVQRWVDGTEIPEGIEFQYRFLMQIGYVGEEEIRLFLPDCIVIITGKNLRELRKKLARRQVTFVSQYSARVWPESPGVGEPTISEIAVVRPEPAASSG